VTPKNVTLSSLSAYAEKRPCTLSVRVTSAFLFTFQVDLLASNFVFLPLACSTEHRTSNGLLLACTDWS